MAGSDPIGRAIHDFHFTGEAATLWILNHYGEPEEMDTAIYFRAPPDMPELEWDAIGACRGHVLDIGAGAGSHSLALQDAGMRVTALEISGPACEVMRHRGIRDVIQHDIFAFAGQRFNTLLLLMNGIGLCGSLEGLRRFLDHARTLLSPGGKLLFDSSDIAYLYEGDLPIDKYYGEIAYRYRYKEELSDWFSWLYVDRETLKKVANEAGWEVEVTAENDEDGYLATLLLADS
ncbi:class I SAM-dependent methyltransferase [Hufsiella ginkgonis]|uniref:Methyltransferase domain-containing protein n=1 Tax=Hufsiella ginkgonis TaxID=2695274 RepID=A0A7K1Y361_9SPHI|nr:class I SAM-dependent methyltransferase [Hufsiella ginkgonis]MXV17681.1 methyltransferase domain-containing protein [Hufsiella ginkgonis]